jgi:hypothetical protein
MGSFDCAAASHSRSGRFAQDDSGAEWTNKNPGGMGPWNPTFRKVRETLGTLFRGAGQEKRATPQGSWETRTGFLVRFIAHILLPLGSGEITGYARTHFRNQVLDVNRVLGDERLIVIRVAFAGSWGTV